MMWVLPDEEDIRERFTHTIRQIERSDQPWPAAQVEVTVLEWGEPVLDYHCDHELGTPFEPFRRLHEGCWSYYALVSPRLGSFAVLDLQTFELVEPMSSEAGGLKAWGSFRHMIDEHGFHPEEFYVPDFWSDAGNAGHLWTDDQWVGEHNAFWTGQFGFMSRGDPHQMDSPTLHCIDLTRLHDGVVTVDERFGRIPVSTRRPLRQTVHVAESGVGSVDVDVPLRFDIRTGEADAVALRGIGGGGL